MDEKTRPEVPEEGSEEHDRIVKKIRDRNRRLSHSVWTDEPVLKPRESVWLEKTAAIPEAEEESPEEVPEESAPPAQEMGPIGGDLIEVSEPEAMPEDYEETVLPLLQDRRAVSKREVNITFDDNGQVQINEVVRRGRKQQVTVQIPGERYAEYRRRSFQNDKSSRRTLTVTIPVTRPEPEPDQSHTMVMTTPVIREQSKGRNYEDPEFSVTPEAEEIAAAMSSGEEEFVREYVPEKERLGRSIEHATARIKAMKAAGLPAEEARENEEIVRLPSGEDLIGYEAARKMLEEQIREAERQLEEEPEPEPIKKFERAPKPRFHKPEFEFINAALCTAILGVGFVTAVTVLLKDGLPRPSFRTWLSGSYSVNVTDKLQAGELERMRLAEPGETLDELAGFEIFTPRGEAAQLDTPAAESYEAAQSLSSQDEEISRDSRVFLTGEGSELRGMEGFYGAYEEAGQIGARLDRAASEAVGADVYSMTVPTAAAFYLPDSLAGGTTDQKLFTELMAQELSSCVSVDVYTRLGQHRDEDIYARTDHRWLPLGAYYAGQIFAEKSGADYPEISECEAVTVEGFAGDLTTRPGCEELAKEPESFTYYKYGTSAQVELLTDQLETAGEGELFGEDYKPYDMAQGDCFKVVSGSTERVLALVADEFGVQLTPFLTAGYGEIWVIDSGTGLTAAQIAEKTGCTELLYCSSIQNAH